MKKKYALPQGISLEINNTVDLVKNNIGTLNYKVVPINAIEFDPENPRELSITRDELPEGPHKSDPLYAKKFEEFQLLKQTAETIKKYGVRNAIEIYKHNNNYRLIHGERRCLSSILAGKKEIVAKVLDEKPTDFDIRVLQLIENVQREDLTLNETLVNIREIIKEHQLNSDQNVEINSAFLQELINRSKTHCINYLAVLNSSEDLQKYIQQGKISSLEKAALIAKAKNETQRNFLLQSCLEGASLKQLKESSMQQKNIHDLTQRKKVVQKKKPGKEASKINLGSTTNKIVIAKIISLVLNEPVYSKFKQQFEQMRFDDFASCASAFSYLLKTMEKVETN